MSYHRGKGKISLINTITPLLVYLETALSSLIQAEMLEGFLLLFLCSNCRTVQKPKLFTSVCVMRPLEVEVETQTELHMEDAEMLLKQTYIIKALHIFLEHWLCAISFLTRKSV